jgi:hypothetical protein
MIEQVETLSQRIISRRPLSRFIQIDRLVNVITGTGTQTSSTFYLPHARYTVFPDADPPRAARSFEIVNDEGHRIFEDWRRIGSISVPLVQTELRRGNYRIAIAMDPPTSSWTIQVVLNSMMSWEAPPKPWRSRFPPPKPIRLRGGDSSSFQISRTGHYAMDFEIGGFRLGTPMQGLMRLCDFTLTLRAADGHTLAWRSDGHWPNGAFLGVGQWTVEMDTDCEWQLIIRPQVGPSGGGARWF